MKRFTFPIAFVLALAPTLVRADLDAVKNLGVRMNDWTFDNGAVLTRAIASGRVNDAIDFPGGVVHHSTTINLGPRSGLKFVGAGIGIWSPEAAHTSLRTIVGNAVTRFVYTGPADQPAWRYSGVGLVLDGIVIQRGKLADQPDDAVGFRMERLAQGPPTGKADFRQVCWYGWGVGLDLVGGELDKHCDTSIGGWWRFDDCKTCVRSHCSQALNWDVQWMGVTKADVVFDIIEGGRWKVSTLWLGHPALVLRTGNTTSNNCYYDFGLFLDSQAAGWRLVEMTQPGPICLRVRGQASRRARPGEKPVVLLNSKKNVPAGYHDVSIDVYGASQLSEFSGKSEAR